MRLETKKLKINTLHNNNKTEHTFPTRISKFDRVESDNTNENSNLHVAHVSL